MGLWCGGRMSAVTLVYSGRTVAISRPAASALADELWKGARPGSATSAAKLAEALASVGRARRSPVRFDDFEATAIAGALDALGLTDRRS
jgi:hypothetical protein